MNVNINKNMNVYLMLSFFSFYDNNNKNNNKIKRTNCYKQIAINCVIQFKYLRKKSSLNYYSNLYY